MERDLPGGSDVGRDLEREFGEEPGPRTATPPPTTSPRSTTSARSAATCRRPRRPTSAVDSPEHDWERARELIYPAFRPVGTQGLCARDDRSRHARRARRQSHAQPLLDVGPAGLPVVYTIDAGAYDIVVNGDHLLSWGVEPADDPGRRDGATSRRWSASAPWTDEVSGERRLVSSDTGDGWDAVRILLPEVTAHLTAELGPHGRILIGLPERHLLTAALAAPGRRRTSPSLFADFIVEQSGGADEPIDRRVFELVDGRLVEFAGGAAA